MATIADWVRVTGTSTEQGQQDASDWAVELFDGREWITLRRAMWWYEADDMKKQVLAALQAFQDRVELDLLKSVCRDNSSTDCPG